MIGLLAGPTVPVGAIVQMILLPPGWDLTVPSAAIAARVIVTAAATISIGIIATRFRATNQRRLDPAKACSDARGLPQHTVDGGPADRTQQRPRRARRRPLDRRRGR